MIGILIPETTLTKEITKAFDKRVCQACRCGGAGSCSSGCKFDHICGKQDETWEMEFDKEILIPPHRDWGICPSQILAIKAFISRTLAKQKEELEESYYWQNKEI